MPISPMRAGAATLAAANRRLKRETALRKAAELALKQSGLHNARLLAQLRQLSRQVLRAQEEERKKISRELHDVIAQTLAGINVYLASLKVKATVNAVGLSRDIARTQRLVEKSVDIVHRFARELRPTVLDDLGIIPALHAYLKAFTARTRVGVRFTAAAGVEQLNGNKRTVLYRVAQEALTNVAKHAAASRVSVSLQQTPGAVLLEVHDDGKSFAVERVLQAGRIHRLGLIGMRERVEMVGGSFSVESAPGQGTVVRAQVPFSLARASRHRS
jgi:two-component system sensor histidine kinase DegS